MFNKIAILVLAFIFASFATADEKYPAFRPPAVPLLTFAPMQQKFSFHEDPTKVNTTYWDMSLMSVHVLMEFNSQRYQLVGAIPNIQNAQYIAVRVGATITTYNYTLPGYNASQLTVTLKFVTPKLFDDARGENYEIPARPANYIRLSLSGSVVSSSTTAKLFVAASASNVVQLFPHPEELVTWEQSQSSNAQSIRLGTVSQNVLSSCGDDFMLDWGYLYLSANRFTASASQTQIAGGDDSLITSFIQTGNLPSASASQIKPPQPARHFHFGVGIAVVITLNPSSSNEENNKPLNRLRRESSAFTLEGNIIFSYDERKVLYYYGEDIIPLWQQYGNTFESAVVDRAVRDANLLLARCEAFDQELYDELYVNFNGKYATLTSLAYRQTLAAISFGYSAKFNEQWILLKEISSDGDENTMDVIFPASPLFFWLQQRYGVQMIKRLLLPILHFANNDTWIPFTQPFSPHQLGVWPIANATTADQEVMIIENTGNMFLMLHKYVTLTNNTDIFFRPYYPVLKLWAQHLIELLPNPPEVLTTDDFAGMLNHSTNQASKGNIALRAFSDLCTLVGTDDAAVCTQYANLSRSFAEFWVENGIRNDPTNGLPHVTVTFGADNSTWTSSYNLLWQRILGFKNDPFQNYDQIAENEVTHYFSVANKYGWGIWSGRNYQKADWQTWSALLTQNKTTFLAAFDMVFDMANDTADRWPLTDLYDITNGNIYLFFRSRPVVGAFFAPLLVPPLQ
jgi:hypothetical protein